MTPGLGGMLPADITGPNAPMAGAPELYLLAHDDPLAMNNTWDHFQDYRGGAIPLPR